MKKALTYITILFTITACTKDEAPSQFLPYYKVDVNGKPTTVYTCGTSAYVCEFLKDTAMFVGLGCGGQGAGFYLKGKIVDSTYSLDNINQAFYSPNQSSTYGTNAVNKGTLTITTGKINNTTTLQGVFEFHGSNPATGEVATFSNGSFLLEKLQY